MVQAEPRTRILVISLKAAEARRRAVAPGAAPDRAWV